MTTLTREDVGRLRELLGKATPGEWHTGHLCRDDHDCTCPFIYSENQHGMGALFTVGTTDEDVATIEEAKANQAIVAAMHEALPALLDLAERYLGAAEGVLTPDPEANDRATFLYFNGKGEVPKRTVRLVPVEGE